MAYIPDYTEQYNRYLDIIDSAFDELPLCERCGIEITDEDENYNGVCYECKREIYKERKEALLRARNLRATLSKRFRCEIGRIKV